MRGSADVLLARGIAAPRRVSSALTVSQGTRRIVKRGPNRVRLGRLGRDRARGKWLILALLFLGAAIAYGAIIGGQSARLFAALKGGVEGLAVASGFGVKRVTVEGKRHATDAAITTALEAGPSTMMLAFDTDAAKARLEALPWIKHAQVMRLLPSTLQVVIEERVPYAIWQKSGETYVIDAEGVVLAPALREAYADLPLVVGAGAGRSAAFLFDALQPYGDLREKLIGAIRVGDRRWTLKLASGLEIMLPDDNIGQALEALAQFESERGLLDRNIAAVDLRLADRVTVRLHGEADAAAPGAPASSDIPTASTKGARPKGNT